MTGISEVLVLILLITGLLILPRMMKPSPTKTSSKRPLTGFSMKMRAGIVVSVIYPIGAALLLTPWESGPIPFVSIGLLPVALAWALVWVFSARKK